jgi:hypothetical protein
MAVATAIFMFQKNGMTAKFLTNMFQNDDPQKRFLPEGSGKYTILYKGIPSFQVLLPALMLTKA